MCVPVSFGAIVAGPTPFLHVRVFVDFWNFTLSIKKRDPAFKVDWKELGRTLATEATRLIDPAANVNFAAMHVVGSYDPKKPEDTKLKNWLLNTLDKFPGVHVSALQRQRKREPPRCPACHATTAICPTCGGDMRGTEEKGVDTRLATDMISLAWANGYNVAVLVFADKDFVPVAEFLQTRGIKVIHASFPPLGGELSQRCWGSISIPSFIERIRLVKS